MTGEPLFDQEWILDTYVNQRSEAIRASALEEGEITGVDRRGVNDARGLLKAGVPVELISQGIGMPIAEVNALKKQMGLK